MMSVLVLAILGALLLTPPPRPQRVAVGGAASTCPDPRRRSGPGQFLPLRTSGFESGGWGSRASAITSPAASERKDCRGRSPNGLV